MQGTYIATILFWPYSTGNGADVDQKRVGPKEQKFELKADDFHDACKKLDILLRGIRTNPDLWNCPVESLVYKQPGDR